MEGYPKRLQISKLLYRKEVDFVNPNSKSKIVLALILCVSLIATGCNPQWLSVALADLPALTQMALNIATVVTTLQSGSQISSSEAAAISNISTESSKDLNLLQALYKEYQANPSASTIQKIQDVIGEINRNLPAFLQAAHISDPVLSARINAGVTLILTTVSAFAALMPQPAGPSTARRVAMQKVSPPHVADLKKQWNQQVCAPTGKPEYDSAFAPCVVN
jgi:hypothetical protein